MLLPDALAKIPNAPESRDGYARTKFKHWNTGEDLTDGCDTRQEVLISEAVEASEVGTGCTLTGGRRLSYRRPASDLRRRPRQLLIL